MAAFFAELLLSLAYRGQALSGLLNKTILAQFVFVILAEAMAVGSVWALVKRRSLGLGFIGLGRKPNLADLKRGIVGFAAFYAILIIVSIFVSLVGLNTNQPQQLGFDHLNGALDSVLAFVALVILPPLGEEPLVRGYLFSGLRAKMKFWPAMLTTSLLFGLAHLEFGSGSSLVWGAGIETFTLSIVLVYLRETTGALYAGILVHFLNNAIAFTVHFH
jgi:membrane protease YdiL (CAAX protease family)